jgi:hypothetical protein
MSITGTAGQGGRPHPNWTLGDLPDLVRHYEQKEIHTEQDLDTYLSEADADLIYGSKLLLAIDRALGTAKSKGINRDMLEDVEFQTGSLVPVGESTRRLLTSAYSRTGQGEVTMALESSGKYGKVALLLVMIAALLKIVGWLVSNGKAYSGSGADGGAAYATDVAGKDTSSLPEDSVATKLKISLLKDLYIDHYKDLKDGQRVKFNTSVLFLDNVLTRVKAEDYLNCLAAASNSKPLKGVFEACASGEYKSQNEILVAAVADLFNRRVTSGIYTQNAVRRAWKALPTEFRNAGVQIPCETVFANYVAGIDTLNTVILELKDGFTGLAGLDLNEVAQRKPDGVSVTRDGFKSVVERPAQKFADATRALMTDVVVPLTSFADNAQGLDRQDGILYPVLAVPPKVGEAMCGYELGYASDLSKSIFVATQSSYFGLEFFEAMKSKGFNLGGDSAEKILAAIVALDLNAMSKSTRVTDLSAYNKLETSLETLRKEIEGFGESVKDQSSEALSEMNGAISRQIKRDVGMAPGDPMGITNLAFNENVDFYRSVNIVMSLAKVICRGAATLQGVIDKSDRNPLKVK